jgi:hypothetical protein
MKRLVALLLLPPWQWWYTNADAAASNARLTAAAICDSGAVYRSTD